MRRKTIGSHLQGLDWLEAMRNFCTRLEGLPFIQKDELARFRGLFYGWCQGTKIELGREGVSNGLINQYVTPSHLYEIVFVKKHLEQVIDTEVLSNIEPMLIRQEYDDDTEVTVDLPVILTLAVYGVCLDRSILQLAFETLVKVIATESLESIPHLSGIRYVVQEALFLKAALDKDVGAPTASSVENDRIRYEQIKAAVSSCLKLSTPSLQSFKKYKKFTQQAGLWESGYVVTIKDDEDRTHALGALKAQIDQGVSQSKVQFGWPFPVTWILDDTLVIPVVTSLRDDLSKIYRYTYEVRASRGTLQKVFDWCASGTKNINQMDVVFDGIPSTLGCRLLSVISNTLRPICPSYIR